MKLKFGFLFISFVMFFGFTLAFDIENECEKKTFIVTAYYSPISGQAFYYKPNYVEEKVLNGDGIAGAGGKKVFNGMLAAPKSYEFGSVIYFPGWGIGQIEDRGGAIVLSGERGHNGDRIDIRMGRGEEGLVRALTFGKQTLTGYFCAPEKIKGQSFKIGLNLEQVPFYENFFDIGLWVVKLVSERNDIWTWTLQKYLIELGYLKPGKQTGFFGQDTKDALCRYQVAKGILSKKNINCGVFSAPTSFVMKQDVKNKGLYPSDLRGIGTLENIKKDARKIFQEIEIGSIIKQYFTKPFNKGDKSDDIKKLQTILTNLSYYTGNINGVFDYRTIDAVYEFQIKNSILSLSSNPSSKGRLGPATRNKLNGLVNGNEGLLIYKENLNKSPQPPFVKGDEASVGQSSEQKKEQKEKVFQFYRAYKKGNQNGEVRTLQKFLSGEKLYLGKIDGIYSLSVINALCEFQKKNNLISSKDDQKLCGYLGPKTREVINKSLVDRL